MIDNNKILILIDTSYTMFYRFYATIKWYALAYTDDFKLNNNPNYDWFNNKIFLEKYEKKFLESIINLVKKKIFYSSDIIFCMDTPLNNLWRTTFIETEKTKFSELKCDYKFKRKNILNKYNYTNIFIYTFNNIIPNIINNYFNIYTLKIDKLEADDIIACISMYLKNVDKKIYIISGDKDFLQLGRDNIYFYDYKNKYPITLTSDNALNILKNKIIYGDKSDCIDGIFKQGYNIKKKDLINDEILSMYLDKNINAKNQYNLNKKLIDFNYIPQMYYDIVINYYTKLFI